MSDPSNLSFHVNLEYLRKEAKSLLKLCRSRDAGTLSRIRAGLPRIAMLDDERAAIEIKLADVQYALAREQGYPSWGVLKQRGSQESAMPDFSQPGADGTLPEGLNPWRWYLGYTVRPEILSTLVRGQEYRIAVSVLRKVKTIDTVTGYAELYARATEMANARATQLKMPEKNAVLHTRILTHGWFRHGNTDLVRAFVTIGASCLSPDDLKPQGERIPKPDELTTPGLPPDSILTTVHKNIHEIYGDIVRDPSDSTGILLVSYGEYVETCSGIDYKPFLKRAERLAKFHRPFLRESGAFRIVRREWFCATNPDIAVVHVYIRCGSGV